MGGLIDDANDEEDDNIFDVADDDFVQKVTPVSVSPEEKTAAEEAAAAAAKAAEDEAAAAEDTNEAAPLPSGSSEKPAEAGAEETNDEEEPDDKAALAAKPGDKPKVEPKADDAAAKAAAEAKPGEAPKPEAQAAAPVKEPTADEYKEFYNSLINKPIKANGKEIKLNTPDEVRRFVQMGAGLGKKLQEMQPHLKSLRMLEKNNLLNENDLSFLIDIHQKNPDAIKKLIKDSGIDPLDLNMEDNASYRPTNHSVSDNEIAFDEALKEVRALPGGKETIQHINETWDTKSVEFLFATPSVLHVIQQQRENGVYDQIATEIDKQKLLGNIPRGTPFLEAYKIAGDALAAAKSLILPDAKPEPKTTEPAPAPVADQQAGKVLGTRTAAPKTVAANNDKAKAAGAPVNSSRRAKETINPLDMADDDFLKTFKL